MSRTFESTIGGRIVTMQDRNPVTSNDLRIAAGWSSNLLLPAVDADWKVPAFRLSWTCRKTLDHLLDCVAWYAHDLAGEIAGLSGAARNGAGRLPTADLLASIIPLAEVLALVTDGKPETARGWHPWGVSDPEGFRAMGTIEILTHTWDIGLGLGLDVGITPEIDAIADRVLTRLFPERPDGTHGFDGLLKAIGRLERDNGKRSNRWRWYAEPPSQ